VKNGTFILVVVLLAGLLFGCGKPSATETSTAPQVEAVTDPSQYVPAVMVVMPGGAGICTGTFISPKAVVTASHCTQMNGTYRIISGFGSFLSNTHVNLGPGVVEDPEDISVLVLSEAYAKRAAGQVSVIGSEAVPGERIQIVGYGCNSLTTRRGAGVKRAGTNTVASVGEYVELNTPFSVDEPEDQRNILGPKDRAGSCFGDSGGPMFRADNVLVGVTHAGGTTSTRIISQYLNIQRPSIQSFLRTVDSDYNLGIFDYCNPEDSIAGSPCSQSASLEILNFLKYYLMKILVWLNWI
jgi:hypothetical protein